MAALRIFARTVISVSKELHRTRSTNNHAVLPIVQISKRSASFINSPVYNPETKYTDFEVDTDPKNWAFVESYLKYKFIPKPKTEANLPSGWTPPKEEAKKLPYYVQRTKNHMQPVYLHRGCRGLKRRTILKKIEGDIVGLSQDLRSYLQEVCQKDIGMQINEPAGLIKIRGDYVSRVKDWMNMKGF